MEGAPGHLARGGDGAGCGRGHTGQVIGRCERGVCSSDGRNVLVCWCAGAGQPGHRGADELRARVAGIRAPGERGHWLMTVVRMPPCPLGGRPDRVDDRAGPRAQPQR